MDYVLMNVKLRTHFQYMLGIYAGALGKLENDLLITLNPVTPPSPYV